MAVLEAHIAGEPFEGDYVEDFGDGTDTWYMLAPKAFFYRGSFPALGIACRSILALRSEALGTSFRPLPYAYALTVMVNNIFKVHAGMFCFYNTGGGGNGPHDAPHPHVFTPRGMWHSLLAMDDRRPQRI